MDNALVVAVSPDFVAFAAGEFDGINQRLTVVDGQLQQLGQQIAPQQPQANLQHN